MEKFDIYERVTQRIIEQLEKGVIPWRKPWKVSLSASDEKIDLSKVAFNRFTKTVYSPLNQMLLSKQGEYGTFWEWQNIGGKIKKGSKAEFICFWKLIPIKDKNEKGEEVIKQIPFLKSYNVFHISDIEGVEPLKIEEIKKPSKFESYEEAENIIAKYIARENISLSYGGNRAYYSPMNDTVRLPQKEQFTISEEFYSTAFHELTHSTLTVARCNRKESIGIFGSENYSKEELVAELGASGMLSLLNMETVKTFNNSTAYIQSWLKVLRNDKKMIVSASTKAEEAINYIINGKPQESEEVA